MTTPPIRFLFFPSRTIGYDIHKFREIINYLFPPEWDVFVIERKPHLMEGYKPHIHIVDMYADPIYQEEVSDKDIIKEEKWLGISFNTLILMEDRYFHTSFNPSVEKKRNIVRHIRFFRKTIQENKINFCFIGYPAEINNNVFLYVIKRLQIRYVDYLMTFTLSKEIRYLCLRDYAPVPIHKIMYDQKNIDKACQQMKDVVEGRNTYFPEIQTYMKKNFGLGYKTIQFKMQQFKEILENRSPHETHFRPRDLIIVYLRYFFNVRLNNILLYPFIFSKPNPKEKYYYFPLHFERDASITFKEPLIDQIEIIKNISYNLPHKTVLYVKTHPNYLGGDFSYSEFRRIKKHKNVRIIHYKANNLSLLKNAIGVITINSTAGLEAIALGKPVITFGDEFYAKKPICIPVKDLKKLASILVNVINDPNYEIDPEERKRFLYYYYECSFPLQGHLWDVGKRIDHEDYPKTQNALRQIADTIFSQKIQ